MSDGAAFVLVMGEDMVKELGLEPIARMVNYAAAGVPPRIMGIGPVKAIPKALKQAGLSQNNIELIELNEAFASQSLAVIRALDLNPDMINVNGGAIALGMKEKLDPYLQPLYDALMDMLPPVKLAQYIETGVIQIAPLGFMRGRTLDHAFVILDEAQNSTDAQTRMFLTRMGNSAKFIITGDVTQIDLPKKVQSGLRTAWNMLNGVKGISFIELGGSDIVRHPLVKRIVDIYAKSDEK